VWTVLLIQVFQKSTPDFVSACALLNPGVRNEVLNLPHEAGDEHTGDLIGAAILRHRTLCCRLPHRILTKSKDGATRPRRLSDEARDRGHRRPVMLKGECPEERAFSKLYTNENDPKSRILAEAKGIANKRRI
jgi:hypothetical protein